jgi:hypothetical protein
MESFLQQANVKLVPNYLEVEMDFVDDTADQQRATIQDIDSRNFERQMSAGVTTPEVVQQIQYERGYIKRHQLRAMQLSRANTVRKGLYQAPPVKGHAAISWQAGRWFARAVHIL